MSLNTTQIIHIVADVAILMSITVYFMNENKKLVSQIDTLSKKVESQEERITKQDGVILEILKHLDNTKPSFKEIVIEPSLPSPLPPGCCFISSTGNQVCSPIEEVDEEDDDNDDEEDDGQHLEENKEEEENEPQLTQVVIVVPTLPPEEKKIEPSLVSKVEEIIEEEEIPPVVTSSVQSKKRKRKKSKTSSSSSPNDIDKELENELNELLKEEQGL